MTFDSDIKDIKKIIAALTGKESDVIITYKGTSYGLTKPWNIRCDAREINHADLNVGASVLVKSLREELVVKISLTEKQAAEYRKILGVAEN